jgi:septum formation protein
MPRTRIPLVLASASPRRRELLGEAGYVFEVWPPNPQAECGVCSGETPPQLVARLAWQKAADVVDQLQRAGRAPALVLACDTVAECHGQVLGKPRDEEDARAMLRMLSGRLHRVYSGVCLWPLPAAGAPPAATSPSPDVQVECTQLRMDELTWTQIEDYMRSELWVGKAGAFGYQDRLGWVHVVDGSETNVVGLPMERVVAMLRAWHASDPPPAPLERDAPSA